MAKPKTLKQPKRTTICVEQKTFDRVRLLSSMLGCTQAEIWEQAVDKIWEQAESLVAQRLGELN